MVNSSSPARPRTRAAAGSADLGRRFGARLAVAGGLTALAAGAAGAVMTGRRWRRTPDPCLPERRLPAGRAFAITTDDGAVLDGVVVGNGPTVVLAHCWTGSRAV